MIHTTFDDKGCSMKTGACAQLDVVCSSMQYECRMNHTTYVV